MKLSLTTKREHIKLFCILQKPFKEIFSIIIIYMFSYEEQEEIISKFLNVIEMKTIIKDKVSMCKKCKFNQQNMSLYKLNILDNIVRNICKYSYEECDVCKTLKEFKENVYDCSMKHFENLIEAVEDKHTYNIEDYVAEKWNTQIYYYVSLNPFPTYKKVSKEILKGDDTFYNKDIHKDIKFHYETLFNLNMQTFYTKYRNKIIHDYDKTVDKNHDTKTRFCINLDKQLGKMVSVIKQILEYITSKEEHYKIE